MATELDAYKEFIDDVLATMTSVSRTRLLRQLGLLMRRQNQARQTKQIGLDGAPWAPRRDGSRRKMMKKLKLARNLRIRSDADSVAVGWRGQAANIARVHHFGLRDRVDENGVRVKYAARTLLGQSQGDAEQMMAVIEKWLNPA